MKTLLMLWQLINFPFIWKLIEAKVISPMFGRVLEWAIQTLILWLLTYVWNVIEVGSFVERKATLVVLSIWFAKTIWSWVIKAYRDSIKEKEAIIDTIS